MEREPCPWRIVDDAGGAFAFGLVGGGVWNAVGGARNAPKGQMLANSFNRCRARAPIVGGSFAVWGTFFSIFDCSFAHIRKKEDPWNAIMSGAATGGLLALRAGLKSAAKSAVVGGVILAVIEGLNIGVQRVLVPYLERSAQPDRVREVDLLDPPKAYISLRKEASSNNKVKGSIWDLSTSSPTFETAPSPSAQPAGFDLDSVSQFDTKGDWKAKTDQQESSPSTAGNSWWRPW